MVAIFCLRLACGLLAALLLLSPAQVNPRFFRTHFLTALGLVVGASVFLRDVADGWLWAALVAAAALAFVGSMVWLLEGAPGGRGFILITIPVTAAALVLAAQRTATEPLTLWAYCDHFASAALLGSATTAMLIGHSYLVAPAMSLTPLFRLLGALSVATLARMLLAIVGLWLWTSAAATASLETETLLWLPVRWLLGFIGPLVLGWMAWEAAKIRSTQSATGILYVVVILCFLGELTSQLLWSKTGFVL
jgi:hypothetical protein